MGPPSTTPVAADLKYGAIINHFHLDNPPWYGQEGQRSALKIWASGVSFQSTGGIQDRTGLGCPIERVPILKGHVVEARQRIGNGHC
ncbi:hypothetical protein Ancab_026977 [Ancistrocladus abbreviatus]